MNTTRQLKLHFLIPNIINRSLIIFILPVQDIVAEPVTAMSKGCVWNQNVLSLLEDADLEVVEVFNGLAGLIRVVVAAPKS